MKFDKHYVTNPRKIWSWRNLCKCQISMLCLLRDGKWKYLLSFISKASTKFSFFRCRKVKQFILASLIFSPKCHINVKIVEGRCLNVQCQLPSSISFQQSFQNCKKLNFNLHSAVHIRNCSKKDYIKDMIWWNWP